MKKSIIYFISVLLILSSAFIIYVVFNPSPLNTQSLPIINNPQVNQDSILKTDSNSLNTQSTNSPTDSNLPDIKSDTSSTNIDSTSIQTPIQNTPVPTPDPQTYACGAGGICNSYLDPEAADCPITFKDRYCENRCGDPSVRCRF